MPPFSLWFQGRSAFGGWLLDNANACAGVRLVPVAANGSAAFAIYKPTGGGRRDAYGVQVLDLSPSGISAVHTFLEPSLFELFDLPPALSERPSEPRSGAHRTAT